MTNKFCIYCFDMGCSKCNNEDCSNPNSAIKMNVCFSDDVPTMTSKVFGVTSETHAEVYVNPMWFGDQKAEHKDAVVKHEINHIATTLKVENEAIKKHYEDDLKYRIELLYQRRKNGC